ncbi:hypothetical protein ACCS54_11605 [Rhizobium johnstonii]|uniref:hypothetical protein n=1 Tax=Rhizobium TaxID=379 RepID=UPI001030A6FF|nr:hypothetical protein [Rhizobium leguminosarum]TBF82811.1 hypothetical protein ELG86_12075 [Rhizobium leguminosarum]TBF99231.1 hypothetical protein ELG85_11100 [Rhizobium leguminosarum]TBG68415.1 hypothetical protein ELG74_11420 [Rhizobium leguminosarum]TBH02295.1 hypothetical protein ELG70_12040 [Rhizobium leguminosarum]TBH11685.1 hypothetical protein ELG68_11325 [Rhizobium leguminosarum]
MAGNGLPELNGGVVAGEGDAVGGWQGEVVPFSKAIFCPDDARWREASLEARQQGAALTAYKVVMANSSGLNLNSEFKSDP